MLHPIAPLAPIAYGNIILAKERPIGFLKIAGEKVGAKEAIPKLPSLFLLLATSVFPKAPLIYPKTDPFGLPVSPVKLNVTTTMATIIAIGEFLR